MYSCWSAISSQNKQLEGFFFFFASVIITEIHGLNNGKTVDTPATRLDLSHNRATERTSSTRQVNSLIKQSKIYRYFISEVSFSVDWRLQVATSPFYVC